MGRVRGPGGLLWKNVGVWWGWGDYEPLTVRKETSDFADC